MSKYYKQIDLIRVIACIAILLYHIGILKGGYLAVCTFFVLSGYLSVISLIKKEKFSLKDYYLNKLKKIYLPLLVVVFISIAVASFIPNINLLNLKPETTSIIFCYNNYWQLNANLDYFVRHIDSPFMHLWYMSILIQFDIVFPFIFIVLKKIGEKVSKIIPCILPLILAIISYIFFYKTVTDGNIMSAYYGTFYRIFSILFGLLLGFIHSYYHSLVLKKEKISKIIFYLYIIALILVFTFIDAKSPLFNISMLLTTLISVRLIDYATINKNNPNSFDKIISSISKVSYLVYLTQYPVIFLFQNIKINNYIKIPTIIIITFIISYFINYTINFKKEKNKFIIVKTLACILVSLVTIYGLYQYIIAQDHTKEMHKLEEDLAKNRLMIEEKQKQYREQKKNEEDEWEKILNDLDNSEKNLKEMVRNLNIVGIGDSIMELAVKDLYKEFPNGYFDAVVNRTEHQLNEILIDLKNKGLLGDVILLNLGTNGECSENCKETFMKTIGNRKVFWLNATHPDFASFNPNLIKFAEKYNNVHIIDWISVTKDHPEYLISDKVHPTVKGCKVYAETIYNAIYQEYLNEFNKQKEEKIKEHEEKEKSKITFIGNDLLSGIYEYLEDDYNSSEFIIDKNFTFESLIDIIKNKIDDKSLSNNILLAFDKSLKLSKEQYKKIIELCRDYNIYIVNIGSDFKLDNENVKLIDFTEELNNNYLAIDGIHLTSEGNIALTDIIKNELNK